MTQILNVIADKVFPNKYSSDFAVQVTSNVPDAQRMTIDFRNNKLNGTSQSHQSYRTSKTRICVTVGMMTTGYDCTDILNICLMRPIYSPSEFIQMKGRGTRRCDFAQSWIVKDDIPDSVESQKQQFLLFDFFGNYDYFEKDYDYDEVLKLPSISEPSDDPEPRIDIDEVTSTVNDPLAELKEILIADDGMKIDRNLYRSFKKQVVKNNAIRQMVQDQDFEGAEQYLNEKVFDKPNEFFTIDKLGNPGTRSHFDVARTPAVRVWSYRIHPHTTRVFG